MGCSSSSSEQRADVWSVACRKTSEYKHPSPAHVSPALLGLQASTHPQCFNLQLACPHLACTHLVRCLLLPDLVRHLLASPAEVACAGLVGRVPAQMHAVAAISNAVWCMRANYRTYPLWLAASNVKVHTAVPEFTPTLFSQHASPHRAISETNLLQLQHVLSHTHTTCVGAAAHTDWSHFLLISHHSPVVVTPVCALVPSHATASPPERLRPLLHQLPVWQAVMVHTVHMRMPCTSACQRNRLDIRLYLVTFGLTERGKRVGS